MAQLAAALTGTIPYDRVGEGASITWGPLTFSGTDYGEMVSMQDFADRSVQVLGTLGVGGSVRIEGSNKDAPVAGTSADWAVLTDPQGNALDINALKIEAITEMVKWIRPRVTAGDGTTSLTVHLFARRTK